MSGDELRATKTSSKDVSKLMQQACVALCYADEALRMKVYREADRLCSKTNSVEEQKAVLVEMTVLLYSLANRLDINLHDVIADAWAEHASKG